MMLTIQNIDLIYKKLTILKAQVGEGPCMLSRFAILGKAQALKFVMVAHRVYI